MSSSRYFWLFVLSLFFVSGFTQAQINGLDYTLQKRRKAEKFESGRFSDHMFISGGLGANMKLSREASGIYVGPLASFYVGKWFTPVIGSRVGLDASYMSVNNGFTGNKAGIIGVNWDYLMNLSAFANRYNPDRLFELVGILGISYHNAFRHASYRHVWGLSGGFQGKFNLSPLVDLFIEPELSIYRDNIDDRSSWRKYDLFGSVMLGVSYKMIPVEKRVTTAFFRPFRNNMFISGGVGTRALISRQMFSNGIFDFFGPSAQVAIGGWITPVSGIRFSADGGFSDWKAPVNGVHYRLKTVGLRADYLLNFNTAFGGYNRNRLFEVVGVAGIEGIYAKKSMDKTAIVPGAGIGLQGNLRLTKDIDFYVEPRMSFYTNRLAGGKTVSKLDALGSLSVGIIYNTVEREIRKNQDKFADRVFSDNMFIALSGGLGRIVSRPKLGLSARQALSARATISLGKWFTAISGLRVNGTGMIIGSAFPAGKATRYNAIIAGADYMFNITSVFAGYKEDRLFNLIAAAGPSAFYRNQKVYPALEAGLQAQFNVTSHWNLFLEPHLLWVADRNALSGLSTYKTVLPTVNIGVGYTFRGYDRETSCSLFEGEKGFSYFASVSGGISTYVNNEMFRNMNVGPIGRISLGRWFSPLSAWRLSLSGEQVEDQSGEFTVHGGLDADYMLNLSTLAAGYNPDRLFSLSGILGAKLGLGVASSYKKIRFIPGISAGLQGAFRVTPALDIFLEPQISTYFNRFDGIRNQVVAGDLLLGLTYKFKNRSERYLNTEKVDNSTFVSAGVGTGVWGNTVVSRIGKVKDKLSFNADVSLGYWFNSISGVRLSFGTNTFRPAVWYDADKMTILSLRSDYLVNLTSCFSGYDPDRLFDMIGIVGVGAAFPTNVTDAKTTYTAIVGMQAKFNINRRLSIFVEPRGSFFGDKVDGKKCSAKFDAAANLLVGTTYSF